MTLTKGLIALAIIVAVSGVVVGNPVTFLDGMTQRMLDRKAAINQAAAAAAAKAAAECTVENGCVGKGPEGTYPTEASLLQSTPVRVSHNQSSPQTQPSSNGRVHPLLAGFFIFVLGLGALGVLILIGGSGRGSR